MKKILLIMIFIALISLAYAETEIYPVNQIVELKYTCTLNNAIPSPLAQFNITISYPNGTTFINDDTLALGNGAFAYNTTFPIIGTYQVQTFCWDGAYSYSNVGYYEITGNGKADPSGSIVVLFSIIFIITVLLTCYIALYTLGHLMSLDFDILDLAWDIGIYAGIIAIYFLQNFYLGNNSIQDWLLILIKIGGVFLVLIPIIALILSITIGTLQNKGVQQIQQPRRFRWRR